MRSGQINNAGRGMWSLGGEYISPKEWRRMHKKIAISDTVFDFYRIKIFPNLPLISIIFSESSPNNMNFLSIFPSYFCHIAFFCNYGRVLYVQLGSEVTCGVPPLSFFLFIRHIIVFQTSPQFLEGKSRQFCGFCFLLQKIGTDMSLKCFAQLKTIFLFRQKHRLHLYSRS